MITGAGFHKRIRTRAIEPHQVDTFTVGSDRARSGEIVEVGEADEARHQLTEFRGDGILVRHWCERVQIHFEARAIVRGHDLAQQAPHHMLTKIGRHVADPDAIASRPWHREWRFVCTNLLLQPVVRRIHFLNRVAWHVAILDARRGYRGEVGLIGAVRPVECKRQILRLIRGVAEETREHQAGGDQFRRQRCAWLKAQEILHRVLDAAEQQQIRAQCKPDFGVGGRQFPCPLEMRQRKTPATAPLQRQRQVAERFDRGRRRARRRARMRARRRRSGRSEIQVSQREAERSSPASVARPRRSFFRGDRIARANNSAPTL
jgi:hypothetical protein